MATRIGGARRKTRSKMTKPRRAQGKISLTSYFKEFKPGDVVALKAEPAVQKGMYFRRFHGKTGLITKKLGTCYEVTLKDQDKTKRLIVHPVHLKRA